jgi:molybdopterin-guanine dinucleotide biosynthesis protein A
VSTLVPGQSIDPIGTARADGCVLAGGAGRRFGRPKADVRLGDRTLVERAVAALVPRCGRVVVVSRPGVPLPALPVPVVLDRPGPDCPLVGVATGLEALAADDAVVLGCDLPLAGPLLDALIAAPPGVAVVASRRGRPQPLCARYPRARALAACERLLAAGALPLAGLLDALGAATVEDRGDALLNVNTPQDLARAMMILREPSLS